MVRSITLSPLLTQALSLHPRKIGLCASASSIVHNNLTCLCTILTFSFVFRIPIFNCLHILFLNYANIYLCNKTGNNISFYMTFIYINFNSPLADILFYRLIRLTNYHTSPVCAIYRYINTYI